MKIRKKIRCKYILPKAISESLKLDTLSGLLIFVFFVSMILGILFYLFFGVSRTVAVGSDLVSYLTGAMVIRQGKGEMIYDLSTQFSFQQEIARPSVKKNLLPFRSPPVVGLIFVPFTYSSLVQAYKLFALFNLLILVLFTFFSVKIFKKIINYKLWAFIPFIFVPAVHSMLAAQISLILMLLYLFLYKFIKSEKSQAAGVLCGLLLLKPQYIISLPFFFLLSKDRRRFIIGFISSFLLLVLVSVYVSGMGSILNYPQFLLFTESSVFGSRAQEMFSVGAIFLSNLHISSLGLYGVLAFNAGLYFTALFIFVKRYKLVSFDQSFITATLFSLVFAIHVLSHDLTSLLVPVFVLLNRVAALEARRTNSVVFFTVSLLLLQGFILTKITPVVTIVLLVAGICSLYLKQARLVPKLIHG